jgi:predicted nucleic acid-binding protein
LILVDSSIWVDHLHHGNDVMRQLLASRVVVMHPFVLQEIALGSLRDRSKVLFTLRKLPQAKTASTENVMLLIESRALYSTGIDLTDVHLLAAALINDNTLVWTRDRRMREAADRLGVCYTPILQ